jgi:hypothetical protein
MYAYVTVTLVMYFDIDGILTVYHPISGYNTLLHIQVSAGDESRKAGAEMSCMAGAEMSCMAGAEVSRMAGDDC